MCVCVCIGIIDFIAFDPHQKKKKKKLYCNGEEISNGLASNLLSNYF